MYPDIVYALAAATRDDDVPFVMLRTVDGNEVAVRSEDIAGALDFGDAWRAYVNGDEWPTPAPAPEAR